MNRLEADKKALETIKKLHLASKEALDSKRTKGNILDLFSIRDLEKVSDSEYSNKINSYQSLSLKNVSLQRNIIVNNHSNVRWSRFKEELEETKDIVEHKIIIQEEEYLVIETSQERCNSDGYSDRWETFVLSKYLIDSSYNTIKCNNCSSAKKKRYFIVQESDSGLYGIYDTEKHEYTVPPSFVEITDVVFVKSDMYFIGKSENLYGVFDISGGVVIPPMFKTIKPKRTSLIVTVEDDRNEYLCDITGKIISLNK